MKRLETIANISVIVAAVVLVAFFGRQEFQRHAESIKPASTLVGQTVTLPGVRFGQQSKTLVLAISTHCHFCRDSEPFYKDLVARSQGRLKIVAVLPESLDESEPYVRQSIAPSIQVVSSRLDLMGVSGTPTLLLIDRSGKVQQAWVGKLDDKGQQQVQSLVL
ncbi:MAG: hypothetical protein ABR907_17735 [Terracidiphilus sp.]|jgi:hypothetical protein